MVNSVRKGDAFMSPVVVTVGCEYPPFGSDERLVARSTVRVGCR